MMAQRAAEARAKEQAEQQKKAAEESKKARERFEARLKKREEKQDKMFEQLMKRNNDQLKSSRELFKNLAGNQGFIRKPGEKKSPTSDILNRSMSRLDIFVHNNSKDKAKSEQTNDSITANRHKLFYVNNEAFRKMFSYQ
jgi:hypothetical protein